MTDIVLPTVTTGYNISTINSNFDKVEDSINNDVLHLADGKNIMRQPLDMNGQPIINYPFSPTNPNSLASYASVLAEANTRASADTALSNQIATIQAGINSGYIGYQTKVLMDADHSKPSGTLALVTNDPTTANNTTYRYDGSVWQVAVDRISLLSSNLALPSGSTAVGFQQLGTNTTVRTVQDKLRDSVSIKDFGAKGDGVTDDSAAFTALLAWANSRGSNPMSIYFPQGKYLTSVSMPMPSANYVIYGDGPRASQILFTSTGNLFSFYQRKQPGVLSTGLDMHGLSLFANVAQAGTAISVTKDPAEVTGPGDSTNMIHFYDMQISGVNSNNQTWTKGIYTSDADKIVCTDITMCGLEGDNSKMATAFEFGGSIVPSQAFITNAIITWVNIAVAANPSSVIAQGFEGIHISQSDFVVVKHGIYANSADTHITFTGGHIAYELSAVTSFGYGTIYISDNLFYQNSTAEAVGININSFPGGSTVGDIFIHDNTFEDLSVPLNGKARNSRGIIIQNAENSFIHHNKFRYMVDGVILAQPQSGQFTRNIQVTNNTFVDSNNGIIVSPNVTSCVVGPNMFFNVNTRLQDFNVTYNYFWPNTYVDSKVINLVGGGLTETVNISLPPGQFGEKPLYCSVQSAGTYTQQFICTYLYDDAGTNANNCRVQLVRRDGTTIAAGANRLQVVVHHKS